MLGFSGLLSLQSCSGEDKTIYFIELPWAASKTALPGTQSSGWLTPNTQYITRANSHCSACNRDLITTTIITLLIIIVTITITITRLPNSVSYKLIIDNLAIYNLESYMGLSLRS